MDRGSLSRLLFGVLAVGSCLAAVGGADDKPAGRAVEPWADPRLTVTRGLALWLDAARLNAGREATGGKPVSAGDRVDAWPDASGHGLHLSQPDAAARPTFHDADGYR